MSSLLVQVALYGVAAAFAAPIAVVVSALILGKSRRPIVSAWTFAFGAAFLDAVFAVAVLASGAFDSGGDAGAYVDVGLGVIFAALGLFAVFGTESPEKDAARQARAEGIATAKLGKLFVAGILVQVINFDAIAVFGGALKEIAAADVRTGEAILATLFGLALTLSVYYGAGPRLHALPGAGEQASRPHDGVDPAQQPDARDRRRPRLRCGVPLEGPRRPPLALAPWTTPARSDGYQRAAACGVPAGSFTASS